MPPPKGKKGQAGDKGKAGEEERDEPLQAVVSPPMPAHTHALAKCSRYLQIPSRRASIRSRSNVHGSV